MQVEIELNRRNWHEILKHFKSTEFSEVEFDKMNFGFHDVEQIKLVRTMKCQYCVINYCQDPGFGLKSLFGIGLYGKRRVQIF